MAARARFPFDERRRALLQVGLAAFSSRPYDEVSMDQLAATAGVSKGLLYHYFATKRDFYREVLVAAVEDMRQLTEPDPALSPPEQLRAGLVAFLDYARDHAAGFSALLRGGIGSDPEIAHVVADFRRAVLERVLHALGITEPGPELLLALRAWLGFAEAAALVWVEEGGVDRDLVSRLIVRALHAALREVAVPVPVEDWC